MLYNIYTDSLICNHSQVHGSKVQSSMKTQPARLTKSIELTMKVTVNLEPVNAYTNFLSVFLKLMYNYV